MLAIGFGAALIGTLIIFISLLLIALVLLQKNRGSGLSGAFGGVGGHSAFGTKTGDFLTWFTVGLASLFLILCIAGNFMFEPDRSKVRPAGNAALIDDTNSDETPNTDGTSTDDSATGTTDDAEAPESSD